MASPSNEDLDSLLQGFKDKYQESQPTPNPVSNHQNADEVTDLLAQAKSQFKNKESPPKASKESTEAIEKNIKDLVVNSPTPPTANYLEDWKSNFQNKQTQNKTQQDLIYKRNKQDIISQEQQKQIDYKRKKSQAQQWLANLEPHSDEGMWFNQLADSYESRLEAAITYLDTLEK